MLIKAKADEPTAKSCRTVLSNIINYAPRHDAISANVTRNTRPRSVKTHRPRGPTLVECEQWLTQLAADETTTQWDLADATGFLLDVGCRIGEALGVAWDSVDLGLGAVGID